MGSDICGCITQIQSATLIHLSDLQPVIRSQMQRQPGSDIRTTSNSYIGPKTSLILGCKRDQRRDLLNKYLLTYLFFIRNQNNTLGLDISKTDLANIEIQDFTKLMTLSDNHNEFLPQIAQFQAQYIAKSSLKDRADFLITEYFQDRFFSFTIEKFPIYSTDPTILGYLRRPIIDLHNRITAKYKDQTKKKEIYSVIQISKDEEQLINRMLVNKDHLTFSTFLRCFSSEEKARARLRDLKTTGQNLRASKKTIVAISTIFLNITIQRKLAEDYDYGFFQDQTQKDNPFGDIIMNIMNFFEVTGARPSEGQYDLSYGSLAKMIQLRRERQLKGSPQLLKVIDVIEGQCEQIKTHSSLIRHIAQTSLSITASQSLKGSQLSQKAKGEESVNLIEAYLEERNFDKALQQCQGKDSLEFQIRKAQILYEANRQSEAEEILNKITQQNKKSLIKDHFKEYILCEYLSSKIKKSKGEITQGKRQLQALREVMRKEYGGKYEYRGRQIEKELSSYSSGSMIIIEWQNYADGLNIGVLGTR